MSLAFGVSESHPMVDVLLEARIPRAAELNRAIDERDDMLDFAIGLFDHDRDQALANYFQNGLEQSLLVRYVASWRGPVRRMLDFASGYGRLTRFLVHDAFAAELTVSDILEEGMAFQSEQFGVRTIVSTTLPENFPDTSRYDLIFVASLFTHLPPATFTPWLRRLMELLAPEGLLVFSVHDQHLAPADVDGIHFATNSESRVLDTAEYGSTWVTEEFIREQVASIDPTAVCIRLPRALGDWQDVYVVSPAPIANPAARVLPKGFVEQFESRETGVLLSGWATSVHEPVDRVELRVGGALVATARQFGVRPDVAAWLGSEAAGASSFRLEAPHSVIRSFRYQVVTVSAFSREGGERILFLGTLNSLGELTARKRGDFLLEQVALRDQQIAALHAEIAAMKQSRFWKAREKWFDLKARAGLSE